MERLKPGHRWPAVLLVLTALTFCCLALVLIRIVRTREPDFAFLVWNLALAWVPFVLASIQFYENLVRGNGCECLSFALTLGAPEDEETRHALNAARNAAPSQRATQTR